MKTIYYSPTPDDMFEPVYSPLKIVYDDNNTIIDVYKFFNNMWCSQATDEYSIKQFLHNYCYTELTDEQVFLNNL